MNRKVSLRWALLGACTFSSLTVVGCDDDDTSMPDAATPGGPVGPMDAGADPDTGSVADTSMPATGKDPATAPKASVDRFSAAAGTLMVRDATNGLPQPNQAIDFDVGAPFITMGLGPEGQKVEYYNFDVKSTTPAPIYVLFKPGAQMPVPGQLNIIDVIPGDPGYNDFWRVHRVDVPEAYVTNTYTSVAELTAAGLVITPMDVIVNCPVVPDGSMARKRVGMGSAALVAGWFKGQVVKYFTFEERALAGATVPPSPIYVQFNVNPDQPGGGPGSGFKTEMGSSQTHNVVATLPQDAAYSPLWSVNVLDNAAFDTVKNLATAQAAPVLGAGVATVNCPVVGAQAAAEPAVPTTAAALKTFLESGGYKTFKAEPMAHASTGPHGKVRTYVNASLAAALAAGGTNHPVGAASVKELFGSNDALRGWAVLVKTEAASNGGQGFYWYEILDGSVVADGQGVGLCSSCHAAGKDYVLTPAF
ncbi:MAG: hypothetical protein KA712_01205 [Myxococcales bacterium]|nr:hypothetical protein [Myxococcales bacterium]